MCLVCGGRYKAYLAVGPVDLVDHVGQQDLLIDGAVELLVLGVLADLQVVSFEGLVHAGRSKK